ncbi:MULTISPECIES: hypothetical protein [Bacillus amyloliquefaciens group]|uniref:hypothetical protein n=1 Tax=Bacillus TaxID=1386 RepID=UPI000CD4CCF1|nr:MULTISPECIES: hypothetical protein [Bacillus amyloliquefaciens group]POI16653.1 hypothetical protein C2145_11245 [Bacillus velezensis]QTG83411.1 hypothetical protein J4048_10515 [Bacillus amyloliquefaciens]
MKTATDYLVSISKPLVAIEETKQRIQNEIDNLYKELGKVDKELNEFYHKLEEDKFNASEGYHLSLKGQKILRKRRSLKQELQLLNTLFGSLNNNGWTLESLKIAEYKISKKKNKHLKYESV